MQSPGASLTHCSPNWSMAMGRHCPAIHGYLRRRLGAEQAAGAFIQASEDGRHYDPKRGAVRVSGIATNLLRRHHRSEQRRLQ